MPLQTVLGTVLLQDCLVQATYAPMSVPRHCKGANRDQASSQCTCRVCPAPAIALSVVCILFAQRHRNASIHTTRQTVSPCAKREMLGRALIVAVTHTTCQHRSRNMRLCQNLEAAVRRPLLHTMVPTTLPLRSSLWFSISYGTNSKVMVRFAGTRISNPSRSLQSPFFQQCRPGA